jgi:glycosyltransferase involved in cell wall biosynthesis
MIDSIGAHRGMHYYNFLFVSALNKAGSNTTYITTAETVYHHPPSNVPTRVGFNGIYSDHSKVWRGLRYTWSLMRILRWAINEMPDVVHFHFFQIPILDYLLIQQFNKRGIKTVATVHDVLPFKMGQQIESGQSSVFRKLYHSLSGIIINSKYSEAALREFDSELMTKTIRTPHGNFSELTREKLIPKQEAKAALKIDTSDPMLLVFGTIKPNKRLDLLLKALPGIVNSYPRVKLVIAGKPRGQDVAQFIRLGEDLGLQENVIWRLEFISDEEMGWYFSAADVVVFPYEWIYQSGVLLMAMSFAKPIVATAVGGNLEFVEHNRTGLLVSLDEPDTMAQNILALLNDSVYAAAMGQAAAEYVDVELSWEKIAQATLDYYKWLINLKE